MTAHNLVPRYACFDQEQVGIEGEESLCRIHPFLFVLRNCLKMAISGILLGLDCRLSSLVFFSFLEVFNSFLVFPQCLSAIFKRLSIVGKQPLTFPCMHSLLHVVQEFLGHSSVPDARLERSPVLQLDFLSTRFLGIHVERVLYLIDDQYIGDGGGVVRSLPARTLDF